VVIYASLNAATLCVAQVAISTARAAALHTAPPAKQSSKRHRFQSTSEAEQQGWRQPRYRFAQAFDDGAYGGASLQPDTTVLPAVLPASAGAADGNTAALTHAISTIIAAASKAEQQGSHRELVTVASDVQHSDVRGIAAGERGVITVKETTIVISDDGKKASRPSGEQQPVTKDSGKPVVRG
jgi:hypothetical protein